MAALSASTYARAGAQPPAAGTCARWLKAITSMVSSASSVSRIRGKSVASSYMAPVPSSGLRAVKNSGMKPRSVSAVGADSGGRGTHTRSGGRFPDRGGLPEPVHVGADDGGVLVVDEEVDVVLDAHAGLVAARDDVTDPDRALAHQVLGDGVAEAAAL